MKEKVIQNSPTRTNPYNDDEVASVYNSEYARTQEDSLNLGRISMEYQVRPQRKRYVRDEVTGVWIKAEI